MSLAASNGHFWLMHNSPSLILAHQQKCHYLEKNPNSLPRSNWYNVAWLIMVSYFLLISLSLSLSLSLAAFVNCLLWQKRRVTISLFLISFPLGGLNATLPHRTPVLGLPLCPFIQTPSFLSLQHMDTHVWTKWIEIEWSCPSNQSLFRCGHSSFSYCFFFINMRNAKNIINFIS